MSSAPPEPKPSIRLRRVDVRPLPLLSRVARRALPIVFGLALAASGAAAAAAGKSFLGGVEDLPLMAGLTEVAEARVVFDKPGGRIVEAFAVGAVGAAEVAAFYDAALPQLGWTRVGEGAFLREGESLEIGVDSDGSGVTVRFSIAPQ